MPSGRPLRRRRLPSCVQPLRRSVHVARPLGSGTAPRGGVSQWSGGSPYLMFRPTRSATSQRGRPTSRSASDSGSASFPSSTRPVTTNSGRPGTRRRSRRLQGLDRAAGQRSGARVNSCGRAGSRTASPAPAASPPAPTRSPRRHWPGGPGALAYPAIWLAESGRASGRSMTVALWLDKRGYRAQRVPPSVSALAGLPRADRRHSHSTLTFCLSPLEPCSLGGIELIS